MKRTVRNGVGVDAKANGIALLALVGLAACSAGGSVGKTAMSLSSEIRALRERCGSGDAASCAAVGVFYLRGRGAPKNLEVAEEYLVMACESGHADACADLGDLYMEQGDANSTRRALQRFESACRRESLKGCARLGRSLVFGIGVPADVAGGSRLLADACERGEPEGCLNMGGFYLRVGGTKKDHVQAVSWFERAVQKGGGHGALAFMYWKGFGVERNAERARQLFAEGCRLEDAESCVNFGLMCQLGEGGPTDHATAVMSFRRACDLGFERGCGEDDR